MLHKRRLIRTSVVDGDTLFTFHLRVTWLGRLLLMKDGEITYRGNGTVWSEFPSGRRCSIIEESWLSEVSDREKWKKEIT
jgi:hypothetical protein